MIPRLFSFYGDDFTGSTDALEALAANGVPSVLFLDPPDEAQLARFPDSRAIGIAGESRSRGPQWMSEHLPNVFRNLKALGAPICQYKVCSTFDSSPEHGSIGRALELGQDEFGNAYVPIVVAAPHLKRFVLFGNLFASGPGGEIYRIDRHPGMSRHPVTPMLEADLRVHLARQTGRSVALLDVTALHGGNAEACLEQLLAARRPAAVLFDGFDETSLSVLGRLVGGRHTQGQSFAIGSSGLTHALIRFWRQQGLLDAHFEAPAAQRADRLIVISGSCSPVTEGQLRWSMRNGFDHFRIGPDVEECASTALQQGRSVVLYTALGPSDCGATLGGEELGRHLGLLLRKLILRSGVRRVLIAGGDTSSHAVRQLGVYALTFAALTVPGAPLCRCHSLDPTLDGLEIVLKGGQVGPENYFEMVQKGDS